MTFFDKIAFFAVVVFVWAQLGNSIRDPVGHTPHLVTGPQDDSILEKIFIAPTCRCTVNGKCVENEKTRITECWCNPGYAIYEIGLFTRTQMCRECGCGKKTENGEEFNCTFAAGMLISRKKCICEHGYTEYHGICKECKCGEDDTGRKFGCKGMMCICDKPDYELKGYKCVAVTNSTIIF